MGETNIQQSVGTGRSTLRQVDADIVEGHHGSIRHRDIVSIKVETRYKAGDSLGTLTGSVERSRGDGSDLGTVGHQGIRVHGSIGR